MAIRVGSALRAPTNASLRGGSNPLGGKGVIRVGGVENSGSSFTSVSFLNPRGEAFSQFLKSVRGSDSKGVEPQPNPIFKPFSSSELKAPKARGSVVFPGTISEVPQRGEVAQPQVVSETVRFAGPHVVEPKAEVKEEPVVRVEVPRVEASQRSVRGEIVFARPESAIGIRIPRMEVGLARSSSSDLQEVHQRVMDMRQLVARNRARARVRNISAANSSAAVLESTTVQTQSQVNPGTESAPLNRVDSAVASRVQVPRIINQEQARKIEPGIQRENSRQEQRRKRFVVRDLAMNSLRLRELVKGYEELRAENLDGDVEGAALNKKTLIGTRRDVRSVLLDKRGYKDWVDGGQRGMESFLESAKAINRERLGEIVNGNTAIDESFEVPVEAPTRKEIDKVFNPEDELRRVHVPLEVVETIEITEITKEKVIPVDSRVEPSFVDALPRRNIEPTLVTQAEFVGKPSSLFDIVEDNVREFPDLVMPPRIERERIF